MIILRRLASNGPNVLPAPRQRHMGSTQVKVVSLSSVHLHPDGYTCTDRRMMQLPELARQASTAEQSPYAHTQNNDLK